MEFRKILANGLEVVANTNTHLHRFCAAVQLRGGSAYENNADSGLTHLMEHCIPRSLFKLFQEDLPALMTRNGIFLDARTGAAHTEFVIYGSPAGIPLAAEMLRMMFLPIDLSPREYRVEKDRIMAEMVYRQGDGGPHAQIDTVATKGSDVRKSPLGNEKRVNRFSRNRVNAHMQSLLVPGNAVLCLTGCISDRDMELLLAAAETIPMYSGQPLPKELALPENFGKREISLQYQADFNYIRMVFDVDPVKCPKAVSDLIREVLFVGGDSLLHRNLSEDTGLIYGYAWPYVEYRNFGMMELGFYYDPERFEPTIKTLQRTLEQMEQGEFDLEERQFACRARWEATQDDAVGLNASMRHNLMLTDSPIPPAWEDVTKESLVACVRTVLGSGIVAIIHRDDWETVQKKLIAIMGEPEGGHPDEDPEKETPC